ncbi:MAG: Crp/Fnr family transcriptional regulator [Verrucomicrobiota bacterium]
MNHQSLVLDALKKSHLFENVSIAALTEVANSARVRKISKGQYLFHRGDPVEGIFLISSGSLQTYRVNAVGKEQVIHTFEEGDSFAEAVLVTEGGYPVSARASHDAVVVILPKSIMLRLMLCEPTLTFKMLETVSRRLRSIVGLVDDLRLKTVESRLMGWLMDQCPQPFSSRSVTIKLRITKRALAAEMGMTSETFSRTLAKLKCKRLLRVQGREIVIENPFAFKKSLQQNLGEIV